MTVDLNEEELEFIQRMVIRAIALSDLDCSPSSRNGDYVKAKRILEKLIRERK